MSEPNGDSSQNPPPTPSNPTPEGASPSNLARAPRANPPNVSGQKEAPEGAPGAPPGFAELMAWMQTMGGAPTEEEQKAGRTLIPKEQKKFSRRGPEAPKPTPFAETGAPVTAPLDNPPSASEIEGERPVISPPLRSLPPDLITGERKRRSKEGNGSPALLVMGLLGLGLIVGSFFLGRATVPQMAATAAPAAPAAPVVSTDGEAGGLLPPALAEKVDQSLVAESEGDLQKATDLLQQVKNGGGRVVGLDYHLALLSYGKGELVKVLPLLNQSIAEGEEVAACYNLRGTMVNRQKGMNAGFSDLEMAAKIDPFNARYAFFVGEAMRRQGKPQGAVAYLKRALTALREPLLGDFYQLKLRLAQIELGQEKEFSEELTAQLALNPPVPDWLFTAAAVEMHRGNFTAAATYLDRVKALLPEREMLLRLKDFFFYGFSDQKELARFYEPIKRSVSGRPGIINAPFSTENPFERKTPQTPAPESSASPTPEVKPSPSAAPLIDVPATGNVPKLP